MTFSAFLSLASLVTLGRRFGIRPALREDVATHGPFRFMRHSMQLSYVLADIGYNLKSWNVGTALLVLAGWTAMIYRIHAEERILSRDAGSASYRSAVRYRRLPGLW